MALLKFVDNKTANVSSETAIRIWDILNGNAEPADDKELRVCERVVNVYMDWRTAPDSYIKAHFDVIAPMVVGRWMVQGQPAAEKGKSMVYAPVLTRPEPGDKAGLAFCIKWGLFKDGQATALARRYM